MRRLLEKDQRYAAYHGDVIPHLQEMPPQSVDFSVYSPPYPSVFSYQSSMSDIGNSEEMRHEVPLHFSWFFRGMLRVMKPGRVMIVHCQQIVQQKRSGGQGLFDFRGLLIRLGRRAGFVYDYDWVVRVNPQSQALRTKSRALQFTGLEADRAQSRGANPYYLIKFVAPGENKVPIDQDPIDRDDWIKWAECTWNGIRETDTLNVREARSENDTKHVCPLQLQLLERAIRLYSNPDEIVFDPFMGIGSTLYEALRSGRRGYGAELKDEYWKCALRNCERALKRKKVQEGGFAKRHARVPLVSGNGDGAAAGE